MATSTSNYQKFNIFGVFLVILAAAILISAEIDEELETVKDIFVENADADTVNEEADETEIYKQDFETDSDTDSVTESDDVPLMKANDFYSFSVYDIHGDLVSLEKYRGKVVLVVNVASECGFTDGHYKALIRMKNVLSYTNKFEILAFPCNQFGAQEPGTNAKIENWVEENYHPNFPLFSKINVLDGNVPEAWQYLIDKTGKAPNWNFWKYLVTDQGHVVDAWGPRVSVEDMFHLVRQLVDAATPAPQAASQEPPQKVFDHGETGSEPNWNFWKYLVDETGRVTKAWGPWDSVEDIFHDVKEAVDMIGYLKETQIPRHGGEL